MEIHEIEYGGYGKCLSLTNGIIQAIVTIEVGPRIISFSRCDTPDTSNIFFEDIERKHVSKGKVFDQLYGEGSCFYAYGGHRLWLSPEDYSSTYYPDNRPVVYSITEEGVTFTPSQEKRAIQTSFSVMMGDNSYDMMVIHTGKNVSKDMQMASLWALTMLRPEGTALIPQNPRKDGNLLQPNRQVSLWSYTDLRDNRLMLGNRFLALRQDPVQTHQMKIGTDCHSGWCLYQSGDLIFVKRYLHNVNAIYPDGGVSFEGFVSGDYLELETLSPLYRIAPGDSVRHVENLSLLYEPDKPMPNPSDEDALSQWVETIGI